MDVHPPQNGAIGYAAWPYFLFPGCMDIERNIRRHAALGMANGHANPWASVGEPMEPMEALRTQKPQAEDWASFAWRFRRPG